MADSRKRHMPRQIEGLAYTRKKFDYSTVTGYRFLIPTRAGGAMIGKGGEVIKRLRSQFGCRIIVPDSKGPERMVILEGEVDTILDFWNDVIPFIKEYISAKECDYKSTANKYIKDENEVDLRLVVHESQAGALIGKGGERIRHMIDAHKMTIIKVYQLLCPNSNDRVVRLVSTQENVLECLKSMLKLLEKQILKGELKNYDPDNYDETIAPNYGGFISKDSRYPQRGNMLKSVGYYPNESNEDFMPRSNAYERGNPSDYDDSPYFPGMNSRNPMSSIVDLLDGVIKLSATNDDKHVARISLPIQLVTAVIGPDGRRLSDIKRDSGAHVQLDDDRLSDREELFVIRGSPDQIYKAQCLMQLCVRKYGDIAGLYGY